MAQSTQQSAVMSGPAGLSLDEQYHIACQALQHGDLKQANALAQNILSSNEQYAPAYALMAEIAEKVGNLESAARFIDIAIRFQDDQFAYLFKRGQLAYLRKEWDVCEEMMARAHAQKQDDSLSLIILGDAYSAQHKRDACVAAFAEARSIREDAVLEEHEGLAMLSFHEYAAAQACFTRLIAREPNHPRGTLHLAKVYVYTDRLDDAQNLLQEVLQRDASQHEALYFLGLLHMKRGDKNTALDYARRAVALCADRDPYDALLITLLRDMGFMAECEVVLKKVLQRRPGDLDILHTLAYVLVPLQKKDEARNVIEQVLVGRPDDEGLKHVLNALDGVSTAAPPDAYVRDVFDHYAEKFDTHLLGGLGYRTPYEMQTLLHKVAAQRGIALQNLSLLDLGCGTGLGAEVFKDISTYRVGVDLSSKMLEKAAEKKLYDGLYEANIVDYAAAESRQYDLVTALDVLVYIGDIAPLFSSVDHCTKPGGVFAFSVENGDDGATYALRTSGRYAHAASYVQAVAGMTGFKILAQQASVLRKEGAQDMQGWLFIAQKI